MFRLLPLALFVLLLAPTANAGLEQFSHRVVVVGRVVDVDDLPVGGVTPTLAFEGLDARGTCFDTKDVTDAKGDFFLCRYAREIPANVTASVSVGNTTVHARLDAKLRWGSAYLQLSDARTARDAEGDAAFAKTVHVAGRIFFAHPEGTVVDGIGVNATPVQGLNVTIRVSTSAGLVAEANVSTDDQGDYAGDLPMGAVPNGTRVVVEAGGRLQLGQVSPVFRRADVTMLHAALPPIERPGSGMPKIPEPSWLAPLAGLIGVAAWRFRRPRGS